MYLQSLSMLGFKSFASKTILNFHRGVTAVVGPNGCGKSNVLDAIRWVLGEQSAKALRGGEMADVIFSGTDSRNALGMAEVSMTFADCEKELGVEWNEVCITRRVYRDGKGEYFLNKTACRLRDIHELFMDTGVGRSAYSIMEQGKIDLILSSRPEDRRAIFEEAAGITKYKAQKKEALRKLDYTEANLLRVQDIIKEVRRQIGSLQRQAAKARRYQSLMADLRTFDTHLSHKNYRELSEERESIGFKLTQGEDARSIHEAEVSSQEAELSIHRSRMDELDVEAAGLRDAMQNLRNRVFSAENRITTNIERCDEARSFIDRNRSDIAAAEEKIRIQQNQIEETDMQLARMIDTLRDHEQELNLENDHVRLAREERSTVERSLQQISGDIARLEARLNSLRGEISTAAGRREASETRQRLLQGEMDASAQAVAEANVRLEDISRRQNNARTSLQTAQSRQAEAQYALDTAQKARQEAEYALNAASKQAAGIESRLEVLRQLQEEGEGFDEGTQSILRGLDNPELFKPALNGAIADHIRVEERYIPAVEAALGGALQTILFKDTSVAEAAISTLIGKKLGRAAVLPREWIPYELPPLQPLPEGALIWAGNCLTGTGEGALFARKLLFNTVVVESLGVAFALKSLHPDLAFVTLNGEVITRDGVIRGGQSGENASQSVLMRKAQIADLDRDLTEAISRLEGLTIQRIQAVETLENAQQQLLDARSAVQSAEVETATVQNELKLAERQAADLEARRASFARETSQIEEALRSSLQAMENLEQNINDTLASLEMTRVTRAEADQTIEAARQREAAAVESLNEVRVRVATERQQQENLNRQRGPMAARMAELAELLDARRQDIANSESRIESLESESAGLRDSMSVWAEELSTMEVKVAEVTAAREEVHSQAEAVDTALRSARRQMVELQEQKGRLEVRKTQVEMRMENIRSHVTQRYQLDLEEFEPDTYALLCAYRDRTAKKKAEAAGDDAMSSAPTEEGTPQASDDFIPEAEPVLPVQSEGIDWPRIEEIVKELTERLDSMGPVNIEAIQEYEELEQRQIFLEKQNADLVNSKAELLEVIGKINRTTKELFADTFYKIRDNFQVMFTELFGGGKANLILVDENDPLESGIDIIAKPPGKQLQSVTLLSGGERTMAAVALLFAIYMVKPSPFCVLDEMDAPLDESNISRFIKILDKFVGQSQFVVITHNKRTISRADMLYGVTMEEHGVSKLVSVRFSDSSPNDKPVRSVAETFGKHGDLHSEHEGKSADASDFMEEDIQTLEAQTTETPPDESIVEELNVETLETEESVSESSQEAVPVNEAPVNEAPSNEAPSNEAPSNEAPINEAPVNEAPVNEAPVNEAPVNEAPVNEAPVNEAPINEAPINEAPVNEAPINEAPVNEAPVNEAPVNEAPVNEAPVNETPVNETPVNEAPVNEAPINEAPINEAPINEAPINEAPINEAPINEAPINEAPVNEAAPIEPGESVSDSEAPTSNETDDRKEQPVQA